MRILFYLILLCLCARNVVLSKEPTNRNSAIKLVYPDQVTKFYSLNFQHPFWFTSYAATTETRRLFIQLIDSSARLGLNPGKYHRTEINENMLPVDTIALMKLDRIFTDAVFAYCKDVYQGGDISKWIRNDEVSGKYAKADDDYLLNKMLNIKSGPDAMAMVQSLEPATKQYVLLKDGLGAQITAKNKVKVQQLQAALNLYRWISHFQFDKFIVVNIPAETLRYYEGDSLKLVSKVVVGKPATKTPRFSTWCYQVVLYPYWNVPRDIGLRELLPRLKKSPASMEKMNMQLISSGGKPVNYHAIDWSRYNRSNFPYSFRQCTGCENSLGVIKFNLTDPFDVYLHDTNFKLAFLKDTRFLSHGCIRVEKPIELGNYLLDNKLDSNFLKACYKNQVPIPVNLEKKVPVFVVYLPAEAGGDSVVYYNDVYRLFR